MPKSVVVIGAGVVGLATAWSLCREGFTVTILEKNDHLAGETSSKGSGVIHAGMMSPEPLKNHLCLRGRELLYEFAQHYDVPHKKLGKLIVATSEAELASLQNLLETAPAKGVSDLEWLSAEEVRRREPAVQCAAAVFSPSTGIIDNLAYAQALASEITKLGGRIHLSTPVTSITRASRTYLITSQNQAKIEADWVINATGIAATAVARLISDFPSELIPENVWVMGHYYQYRHSSPFSHLVYPLPEQHGLGIHSVPKLSGECWFGPDTHQVARPDYQLADFSSERTERFYDSVRRYFPALADGDLTPHHVGIRPKLRPNTAGQRDFVIQTPAEHGCPGLINLFGIESPGLTASLAIGEKLIQEMTV